MRGRFRTAWLVGVSTLALTLGAAAPSWADDGLSARVGSVDGDPVSENAAVDIGSSRNNRTIDSFNGDAAGVAHVQQNNGSNNSIGAASAVSANLQGDVNAGADATVFSRTIDNRTLHLFGERDNVVSDSFNGFAGEATVQQNNGDNNEIGAATAVYGSDAALKDMDQNARAFGATAAQTGFNPENPLQDNFSDRSNIIVDSFRDASGIATVQQNNGNGNALSSATSVAGIGGSARDIDQGSTAAGLAAFQEVIDRSIRRSNRIEGSFNGYAGVATVQQNNGDANGMSAATSVAANSSAARDVGQRATALGAALAQGLEDNSESRQNLINPSFNGASGVVTVQQNNGNGNGMSAATSVAGNIGSARDVDQRATALGVVALQEMTDNSTRRSNRIENSFNARQGNSFAGVATVQQNNGDGNAVSAATSVTGIGGNARDVDQRATAGGLALGQDLTDNSESRQNLIDSSFGSASGVITVQQNEGNGNAISAATSVASIGGARDVGQTATAGGLAAAQDVTDESTLRTNRIEDSFNGYTGVTTVQQNNGDGNVMSAATAVAYAPEGGENVDDIAQSVRASGAVGGVNSVDNDSFVDTDEDEMPDTVIGRRLNSIDPSFRDGEGVATVQQNNGSNNVVAAATAVFVDELTTVDVGSSEDVFSQNVSTEGSVSSPSIATQSNDPGPPPPYDRQNTIADRSFNDFSGVATVQQNNGDNNVVAAATGVAARIGSEDDYDRVGTNTPARSLTNGTVSAADSTDDWANRQNTLDSSFDDASGIATVQQNNGNNNVMGSATGVVANIGTEGSTHGQVDSRARGQASVSDNSASTGVFTDRRNAISGSFDRAAGVVTLQQNNGDNNVMGAATHVTASDAGAPGWGPAMSRASLDATVTGNTSIITPSIVAPGLSNNIGNSFTGATGVMTVQQNNGNNNAIQSAVTVSSNF